ncbi:hypothetical protein Bca101_046200 [Brassica carinata]
MTVDHLLMFLIIVQKQDQTTGEEAQAIVNASSSILHLDVFFKIHSLSSEAPILEALKRALSMFFMEVQ